MSYPSGDDAAQHIGAIAGDHHSNRSLLLSLPPERKRRPEPDLGGRLPL